MSTGNTFTSVGNSTNFGNISSGDITASTIVRTNLIQTADYNRNGVVDAADYIVWRGTLGSTTILDADGDNNVQNIGVCLLGDYSKRVMQTAARATEKAITMQHAEAVKHAEALLAAAQSALAAPDRTVVLEVHAPA